MAKQTITRAEYLQLEGLAVLARRHYKLSSECEAAMYELLGTDPGDFAASDVVGGEREITWLLEREKITVEG